MTITVRTMKSPLDFGSFLGVLSQVDLDSSYPAGGYPLTPTQLGFTLNQNPPDYVHVTPHQGFTYSYQRQPTGTSWTGKLRVYRPSGSMQVVLVTAQLSPAAVAQTTTAEQSFVVNGLLAGDVVVGVQKPTAQAGLGIVGARVIDTAHIGVTFANIPAGGNITPTAAEVYTFAILRAVAQPTPQVFSFQIALTPAAVAQGTTAEQSFVIPAGILQTGDQAISVSKPTVQAGLGITGWRVIDSTHIGVAFANIPNAGGNITPTGGEVYTFTVLRLGNTLQANLVELAAALTPAQVASLTTAEQSFAVTGVQAGDVVIGASKPTAQAGLSIAGARLVSATNIGITFANTSGAGITPTAAETYTFLVARPVAAQAAVQAVVLQPTLSPVAVAANSSVEQNLTVPGLQTGDVPIAISKPTAQAGLGIGNVRLVAPTAGSPPTQVAVTFVNDTAAPITPTAAEVYSVLVLRATGAGPVEVPVGTDLSNVVNIDIIALGRALT